MPYCTIAELETLGARAPSIGSISATEKTVALVAASAKIDGYLKNAFTLPLITAGQDLARACAIIAAYDLLSVRGLNPDGSGSDKNVRMRYEDELKWLAQIAGGTVLPVGVVDSSAGETPGNTVARGRVISNVTRGYSSRGTDMGRGPFGGGD